jgi:hypothetical protein
MVTRRFVALVLALGLAGCANNVDGQAAAPSGSAPTDSASAATSVPPPAGTEPSAAPTRTKPPAASTETISGTVTAGVEPNCLLLQDATGSHLLHFSDPAMRADASVGSKVTLTGHSEPTMMSTCQQGVPFIVTAVRPS